MVKALEDIIAKSSSIVFFGGAGVSTESGIPDFRSAHGLYQQKKQGLSENRMQSKSPILPTNGIRQTAIKNARMPKQHQ